VRNPGIWAVISMFTPIRPPSDPYPAPFQFVGPAVSQRALAPDMRFPTFRRLSAANGTTYSPSHHNETKSDRHQRLNTPNTTPRIKQGKPLAHNLWILAGCAPNKKCNRRRFTLAAIRMHELRARRSERGTLCRRQSGETSPQKKTRQNT